MDRSGIWEERKKAERGSYDTYSLNAVLIRWPIHPLAALSLPSGLKKLFPDRKEETCDNARMGPIWCQ